MFKAYCLTRGFWRSWHLSKKNRGVLPCLVHGFCVFRSRLDTEQTVAELGRMSYSCQCQSAITTTCNKAPTEIIPLGVSMKVRQKYLSKTQPSKYTIHVLSRAFRGLGFFLLEIKGSEIRAHRKSNAKERNANGDGKQVRLLLH